jgi:hypothetical protein
MSAYLEINLKISSKNRIESGDKWNRETGSG